MIPGLVAMGEVGLGGEIRGITRIESRLKEAQQMGFRQALIPRHNLTPTLCQHFSQSMELFSVEKIEEVLHHRFTPFTPVTADQ